MSHPAQRSGILLLLFFCPMPSPPFSAPIHAGHTRSRCWLNMTPAILSSSEPLPRNLDPHHVGSYANKASSYPSASFRPLFIPLQRQLWSPDFHLVLHVHDGFRETYCSLDPEPSCPRTRSGPTSLPPSPALACPLCCGSSGAPLPTRSSTRMNIILFRGRPAFSRARASWEDAHIEGR